MPLAFVLNLALPEQASLPVGIPEALGCSGSGSGPTAPPTPQWFSVEAFQNGGPTVPVPTDGFFAIDGRYQGFTDDEVLASLEVVVTDDAGSEVPGSVSLIEHTLAWTAKQALTVGAHLKASLSATSPSVAPVGSEYTLEVIGEPDALPTPDADFFGWTGTYLGSGTTVSCPGAPFGTGGSCGGSFPPLVSTAYESNGGFVHLRLTTTPTAGVLWLVSVMQSADDAGVNSASAHITGPEQAQQEIGSAFYLRDATKVCAIVVIKDLRTGTEVRSDTCNDVQATTDVVTNDSLSGCGAPPSEAAREVWCQSRHLIEPTCSSTPPIVPATAGASSGGTSGAGSGGADAGHLVTPIDHAPAPAQPNALDPAQKVNTSRTSSGCQLGPGRSPAWLLLLPTLAGIVALRRRALRRAAPRRAP